MKQSEEKKSNCFFLCVPSVSQTENIHGFCYCVMLSVYFVTASEGDDCDENVAPAYSLSARRNGRRQLGTPGFFSPISGQKKCPHFFGRHIGRATV